MAHYQYIFPPQSDSDETKIDSDYENLSWEHGQRLSPEVEEEEEEKEGMEKEKEMRRRRNWKKK